MIQDNFEKHSLTDKLFELWFGPSLIFLVMINSYVCFVILVAIGNTIGAIISFVIWLVSLRLNHLCNKKYNIRQYR